MKRLTEAKSTTKRKERSAFPVTESGDSVEHCFTPPSQLQHQTEIGRGGGWRQDPSGGGTVVSAIIGQ